jgi:hypothetical protein
MHIAGSIPFEIAQACGAFQTEDALEVAPSSDVRQLVAAKVAGTVTFDGVAVSDMQPLQLYTRCADRIEAATLLAVGHNLDIQA